MIDNIIHIDVSELPAPEPLEQVLALLAHSNKNDIICMTHRHKPCMLFNILKERGYVSSVIESENEYKIYIWHSDNREAPNIVKDEEQKYVRK